MAKKKDFGSAKRIEFCPVNPSNPDTFVVCLAWNSRTENGRPTLTSYVMSYEELVQQLDDLRLNIDEVEKEGCRFLSELKRRGRSDLNLQVRGSVFEE